MVVGVFSQKAEDFWWQHLVLTVLWWSAVACELHFECDRTCSAPAQFYECPMGRVVFGEDSEPCKWLRLNSLLRVAALRPSDPSIDPGGPAIDPRNSVSDRCGIVAPSSQPDIFQSATAATASARVAFASPTTSELFGAFVARADF